MSEKELLYDILALAKSNAEAINTLNKKLDALIRMVDNGNRNIDHINTTVNYLQVRR